jgi:hypothetical protein
MPDSNAPLLPEWGQPVEIDPNKFMKNKEANEKKAEADLEKLQDDMEAAKQAVDKAE